MPGAPVAPTTSSTAFPSVRPLFHPGGLHRAWGLPTCWLILLYWERCLLYPQLKVENHPASGVIQSPGGSDFSASPQAGTALGWAGGRPRDRHLQTVQVQPSHTSHQLQAGAAPSPHNTGVACQEALWLSMSGVSASSGLLTAVPTQASSCLATVAHDHEGGRACAQGWRGGAGSLQRGCRPSCLRPRGQASYQALHGLVESSQPWAKQSCFLFYRGRLCDSVTQWVT